MMNITLRRGARSRALTTRAALSLVLVLGSACAEPTTVGDLNNLSEEALLGRGLDRANLEVLVRGLLNRDRNNVGGNYITFAETMARDAYRLDPAENRYIVETIGGTPTAGGFVGNAVFSLPYTAVRTAYLIENGLDDAAGLSAAEKAATRGFVQTVRALNLYRVLELRDTVGIPVATNLDAFAAPAPIVCKPVAMAAISALLDSAYASLQQGGTAFPFALPGGFRLDGDFTTPAAFAKVNRGLKGKVEYYRGFDRGHVTSAGSLAAARAALDASFLSLDPGRTESGIYHTFSTAPGETPNPIADAAIYLNNKAGDSVQAGDRRASKVVKLATSFSLHGVRSNYQSSLTLPTAANLTRPIAILKNAELVLLRAQVEAEQGDLAAATRDVNYVRQQDGSLPALATFTSVEQARNAILYEKRWSLLMESAARLVDLRAYDRLNAVNYARERTGDVWATAFPIPSGEAAARNGDVSCK